MKLRFVLPMLALVTAATALPAQEHAGAAPAVPE